MLQKATGVETPECEFGIIIGNSIDQRGSPSIWLIIQHKEMHNCVKNSSISVINTSFDLATINYNQSGPTVGNWVGVWKPDPVNLYIYSVQSERTSYFYISLQ